MFSDNLLSLMELVKLIDHTNIWPKASFKDIKKLCNEARQYKFGTVCVNPFYVRYAVGLLKGTDTKVGSTCGFPFGANRKDIKAYEAEKAIADGAREIDMVINIGALKSREYKIVQDDIRGVVRICRRNNVLCKVILEMNLLTQKEKITACRIACETGADFLKTGTGLWGPARISDVKLMAHYGSVKAAGGIRTYKQVLKFLKAGASRIGTSSGVSIVKDYEKNTNLR